MDQDLKKALKEMAEAVAALASTPHHPPVIPERKQPKPSAGYLVTIVAGIVAILGSLWAVVVYTVSSEITKAFVEPNKALTKLQDESGYLRRDVDRLQNERDAALLHPGSGASPKAVGEAASELQKRGISLPRQEVIQTGQDLLRSAHYDPSGESWDAAKQILAYVSFLNRAISPPKGILTPEANVETHYSTPDSFAKSGGTVSSFGISHPPDTPELRIMGSKDLNAEAVNGPAFLLLSGGVLNLDHLVMKRIVIENSQVVYDGGPLSMTEVFFVNCTFKLSPSKNQQLFAKSLLSPTAETIFSAGM